MPDSVDLRFSVRNADGIDVTYSQAQFSDLDVVQHPRKDMVYMELGFKDSSGGQYQLTASFHGVYWWLALRADRMEDLDRFWNALQGGFKLVAPSTGSKPKDQRKANNQTEVERIVELAKNKLRSALYEKPECEKAVQDAFETLLHGAEIDFSREAERFEYSSRTYIPDFTILANALAVEVKFCDSPQKERRIVQEINDDIVAYGTRFSNMVFVVYDIGSIREVDRFCQPFCQKKGIHICIVKH